MKNEPVAEAETPEPSAPRVWEAGGKAKVRVIRPEDVEVIETRDVEVTKDVRKWTTGKIGKGKVLTTAPYLQLAWKWPVTPTRGFVRARQTKDLQDPNQEARLVDFETGLVKTYATVRGQYRNLGIAWGTEFRDGQPVSVVIHASDGLAVAWRSSLFESQRLEINGGTGQAWVVEIDANEESTGRYIYWDNLRKPPGTTIEKLPFAGGEFWAPGVLDSADVPTMVEGDSWASDSCPAVEMLPNGEQKCIDRGTLAFTGGWRVVWDRWTPIAYNVNTKEQQRLEIPDCSLMVGLGGHATREPPRMLLTCGNNGARHVWSPERVGRVPEEWWVYGDSNSDRWSTDRTVHSLSVVSESGHRFERNWLDLAGFKGLKTPELDDAAPYTGLPSRLVRLADSKRAMLFDLVRGTLEPVGFAAECPDADPYASADGVWLFGCKRGSGRDVSTMLVDPLEHVGWRFPVFDGEDDRGWLEKTGPTVVGIVRAGGESRLTSWRLEP